MTVIRNSFGEQYPRDPFSAEWLAMANRRYGDDDIVRLRSQAIEALWQRDLAVNEVEELEYRLAAVIALCDDIVDRMGDYDHYRPPMAEDIFSLRAAATGEQQ